MTERPDEPVFTSPGPPTPADPPAGIPTGPAAPAGPSGRPTDDRSATPAVGANPDLAVHATRWGAPGGPTPAERAAARRQARRWVVGVLALVLLVVAAAAGISWVTSSARERAWEPVSADVAEPTEVNAVQLVLGSCLASVPPDPITTVEVVPCTTAHAAQVVGRTDAAPGAVWPGADAVARATARACTTDLFGRTAREGGTADVTLAVWTPTEESWAQGDRTGLCVAASPEPSTGDLLE